ncbi:hypothetical protein N7468_008895 [Penicillium chermesinum]|uniref:Zn(2)-C6 fungal-type domain-containing protein n=1 Tax=Penicillium chermesinum TaxID=63820 RepID=A0A9W9NGU1_9EURO|nr:uncharacterized protein N7468_008895 [Penicillium chermesinum]KAJ5219691.1 hypothetical protein N7468_008895 [Penicillium chermesinum]
MSSKRKAPSSPQSQRKQPRQDPVACPSCRKKKIKCDRAVPCSSCVVRGIECGYGDHGPSRATVTASSQFRSPSEVRFSAQERPQWLPQRQSPAPPRARDDSSITADRLETILMGHRFPSALPETPRPDFSRSVRSNPAQGLQNPLTIAERLLALVNGKLAVSEEDPLTVDLTSYLPAEAEAMALLEFYQNHLSYQYHIIIPSLVKQQFGGIYRNNAQNLPLDMSEVALLFSIAASSLFFQILPDDVSEAAEICSGETAFLAGAALLQGDYLARPTITGLQAALIIGHHLSTSTLSPRILQRPWRSGRGGEYDKVGLELKRRLWWDIVSYDWLIGFLSGPQEFTYTIHPSQVKVNRPLNIEDEDLATEVAAPLSTPTCMSYTLCRLRLSEICRQIIDELAPYHLDGREAPYEVILDLDHRLRDAYAEVPSFFRFDTVSKRQHAALYLSRPSFAWQKCFIEQGWQTRLCRLHRQWFIRGAKDPRYSYSHVVALQSARTVIEVKRVMDEEAPLFVPTSSFFWTVMHHVFIASVILLMDVCFNWDDVLAERRKQEVWDACRMMRRAQQVSSVARQGISDMMAVMRKYWKQDKLLVLVPNDGTGRPAQLTPMGQETTIHEARPAGADSSSFPSFRMEDAWSELLDDSGGVGLDTPGWMDMLSELGTTTMPGW